MILVTLIMIIDTLNKLHVTFIMIFITYIDKFVMLIVSNARRSDAGISRGRQIGCDSQARAGG